MNKEFCQIPGSQALACKMTKKANHSFPSCIERKSKIERSSLRQRQGGLLGKVSGLNNYGLPESGCGQIKSGQRRARASVPAIANQAGKSKLLLQSVEYFRLRGLADRCHLLD
jgi:hypothetical protein